MIRPHVQAGSLRAHSRPTFQCVPMEASDSVLRVSFANCRRRRIACVHPPRARRGSEHGDEHALPTAARSAIRTHVEDARMRRGPISEFAPPGAPTPDCGYGDDLNATAMPP